MAHCSEASDGTLFGFVEVDLRSHADGCNPSKPVGYIEGYVAEHYRQQGVGRKLLEVAEAWARTHNWFEIASDATIDNEGSNAPTRPWVMRLWTAACVTGRGFEESRNGGDRGAEICIFAMEA
jgi:GNAT superfamily N-acetyltransferase